MADKKITTGYIGNALRSSAADHTTTFTDEVFDTERQKYQSEVNTDIEGKITSEAEARELAITAESQARSQNDQLLSQAIAAEQERAEAAEQANATAIDAAAAKNEEQDQKLSELDGQINGKSSEIEIIPKKASDTGYYTGRVGETIGFTSSNGYYYETIDLADYIGKTLRVAMDSTATSTTRRTAICDADGVIIALFGEGDFANGAVFERVVESGWNLRISHSMIAGITVSVKIVGEESDCIVKDIADLKESVKDIADIKESVKDLSEGLTTVNNNITLLDDKVNGGTTQEVIPVGVGILGYYTGRVGEIIGSTSSSGAKYEPIDLADYVGSTISISLTVKTATTSTTRRTAICDANGKILAMRGEGDFSDGSSWNIVVEEGQFLYISYNPSNFTNPVVIATKNVKGYDEQIKDINAKLEKTFLSVQITCDNNSQVEQSDYKVCHFAQSPSSVISGVGNSTILVNVDTSTLTPKDVISFGFLASFDFQNVASISLNGINIAIAEDYRETASGKLYHIDGDSFNRYNMYADGDTSILTINVAANDDAEWKLLIANKVVVNDCMDTTPICLCYDGGSWDGKMNYNGEQISLWTLHEILGLPYTICIDPTVNSFDAFHPIVKKHIASGFATTMLRHVPYTIGGDKQQPTEMQLVDKIKEKFNLAEFSTTKASVLGQHHFDRKIRRCMTKAGVKALRIQADIQGYQGQISRMPNDAEIMCINTAAVNHVIKATAIPFKFPLIAFAHGLGIPPEGVTGYADSTGTVTPSTFARLKELQDSGDVAVLNINDWIAKCGF